jgi:hypothetical protein
MTYGGFHTADERRDLTGVARAGTAGHPLARRADALAPPGREKVSRMPLVNDTTRQWHRLFGQDGVNGLARFAHGGRAGPLTLDQQAMLKGLGRLQ